MTDTPQFPAGGEVCINCGAHGPTSTVRSLFPRRYVDLCDDCLSRSVLVKQTSGEMVSWYTPQPHQWPYHESDCPNLLALGTRGTGKSKMERIDAIIRCMTFPGFKALILRRKIPDLKKSHLRFINAEIAALDNGIVGPTNKVGYYRETTTDVVFKNGSFIQFSHCETLKDVENYLSSEWDLIVFDELSSFTLDMFLAISAAARSGEDMPYIALVRAGSNWLGIGAAWMAAWFVDKNVDLSEYPDYHPDDFEMQFSTLDENRYVNREQYEKRLKNLPEHYRKAWLDGERVIEGAYFPEFRRTKRLADGSDGRWHTILTAPTWSQVIAGQRVHVPIGHDALSWLSIYRAIDWGYSPDPAVCIWFAVFPNGHAVAFKERTWKRTLAKQVAKDIKDASRGMKIIESFCDPNMFVKRGDSPYSVGEQFEQTGVPLTPMIDDRELYGYAIHEQLNTLVDGHPKLQIVEHACPELVRTIPILQVDPSNPNKLGDGPDHWACCVAYFGMGQAMPARDPAQGTSSKPRWMRSKRNRMRNAFIVG